MKILHILNNPRAEGTPNLVLDWLRCSAAEPHLQEVFALHPEPADLTAELRAGAAWYQEESLLYGRGWRKFWRIARAVRRVCAERRPDLVVCWPAGFACWIAVAVRLALGWKTSLQVHCGNPPGRGFRLDWMARALMLPVWLAGGKCVCCSDYVRDSLRSIRGLPDKLFVTVYNCARINATRARALAVRAKERPATDGALCWGVMVATLEAHKDHATLLRALPSVLSRRADFRLRLVGAGSLRAELETLRDELGLGEIVQFLGSRRDVPEWLGRSQLFVFSTTMQEGLGSVLIEALAAGLPIVASDVPACREMLHGGEYGRLVPLRSPAALAEGILAELARPTSTPLVRSAYAARFTPETMMRQYLALA